MRTAAHLARTGERVALAFVDIDDLKAVNDQRGHLAGDALIVTVARRIRQGVRAEDVVARRQPARRCQPAIELAQGTLLVSASIGVTMVESAETVTEAIERADAAMYEAKRNGRDRTVFYQHNPT